MASWALVCRNCKTSFLHTTIVIRGVTDYFLPEKPKISEDGSEFKCPRCGQVVLYQRANLTYQA